MDYNDEAKRRVEAFRDSLATESDRGLILVGGAFLEEELTMLLRSYFAFERDSFPSASKTTDTLVEKTVNSLFSFNGGPLGTFVGKLNLAFSMGLLEEYEFRNLERFGKVRNKFAHKIEASTLKSPEVVNLIKNFAGKKADRAVIADRVAKLAYQIISKTVILNNAGSGIDVKKALGFAAGDPYNLKKLNQ